MKSTAIEKFDNVLTEKHQQCLLALEKEAREAADANVASAKTKAFDQLAQAFGFFADEISSARIYCEALNATGSISDNNTHVNTNSALNDQNDLVALIQSEILAQQWQQQSGTTIATPVTTAAIAGKNNTATGENGPSATTETRTRDIKLSPSLRVCAKVVRKNHTNLNIQASLISNAMITYQGGREFRQAHNGLI